MTIGNYKRVSGEHPPVEGKNVFKRCTKCKRVKTLTAFYPRYRSPGKGNTGSSKCKICLRAEQAERALRKKLA